jgi:uncharacterized protein (TIGR00106 family)
MLIAFSVTPIGVGEDVGEIVAEAVRVVRASGLPNQTDAMFTTVEGDWDEVMAVVKQATDAVAARAPRVSLVIKADVRPGVTGAMTAKVETIERYLGGLSSVGTCGGWVAGVAVALPAQVGPAIEDHPVGAERAGAHHSRPRFSGLQGRPETRRCAIASFLGLTLTPAVLRFPVG